MQIVVLEGDAASGGSVYKEHKADDGYVSWAPLESLGDTIIYDHTPDELVSKRVADADIIVPNKCLINEHTIADAKDIKLICEAATGYNNIDLDYCKKRHIPVTHAVGYSTEAVVQHTFAMLFHILEKLDYYHSYVASGKYGRQKSFTHMGRAFHELSGMRFGILGLGSIGRRVADIAAAFGAECVYFSASGHDYDVPYKSLLWDEFISTCDIISCHAPLRDDTRGLMDKKAFSRMKKSAIFLNLGRGPIVVEDDLVYALKSGQISAAALDVYENEPISTDSPLLEISDSDILLLTPHMAWAAIEARKRLIDDIALTIKTYIDTGEIKNRIV